jgi:3'(2'), 5'-bisphosphate nucleotidase
MAIRAHADAESRLDRRALERTADSAAQERLARELARLRPNDAVLSEEAEDSHERLGADRVWIIDPLDGTREFSERSPDGAWRIDFAVHVALWERGAGLTAAAVALPALGTVLGTESEPPLIEPEPRSPELPHGPLRIAVSRSRPPAWTTALMSRGEVDLVPMGSLGYKTMSVVRGEVDAYVHAGGIHEWDVAAPAAVACHAGLIVTRLDGSELRYNQRVPWIADVLVCPPALIDDLRAILDAVMTT